MRKIIFAIIFSFSLFTLFASSSYAKFTLPSPPTPPNAPAIPEPPEISGDFEIPERPGMRVRVFVHGQNPSHRERVSSQSLVCDISDPENSNVVGATGWHLPSGVWTYNVNPSSVPSSVGSSNLDTFVQAGLSQLSDATGGKTTFVRGSNYGSTRARYDGKNLIAWGRTKSGTLGVTYTWYYTSSGQVAEVDTIMNSRVNWTYSGSNVCADTNSYDAGNIMTHELGHWLGLNDMYDANLFGDATMYGYGSKGEVKKTTLSSGDKAGVSAIYSPL